MEEGKTLKVANNETWKNEPHNPHAVRSPEYAYVHQGVSSDGAHYRHCTVLYNTWAAGEMGARLFRRHDRSEKGLIKLQHGRKPMGGGREGV